MNKIFTQIALGAACLFVNVANAQVSENFEGTLPSCFTIRNSSVVTGGYLNSKSVSLPNNTTTTGAVLIQTPYIAFSTTTATISFRYHYTSAISGQKTRNFRIGTVSQDGTVTYQTFTYRFNNGTNTSASIITLDRNSLASANITASFTTTVGTKGIIVEYTSDGGNGNVDGFFDDLTVNGNYHYGTTAPCNAAPVATNNNYATPSFVAVSGNVLTDGVADSDANGEAFTAAIVSQPLATAGKLSFNAAGEFTFTPAPEFKGGPVTFTYRITDNGYTPTPSNEATVTITYPEASILPVKITTFAGSINAGKASLTWNVADNETGHYFEVQKSVDGKSYNNAGTVYNTTKAGTEIYQHTDNNELNTATYYRLKVVNKDNSTSYSKVVLIKNTQAVADNKLTLMQNPVQSALSFSFATDVKENTEVAIYNMAGVKVYSQNIGAQKGSNNMSLSLDSKIIKGNYVLTVQNSTGIKTAKFIKQ